MSREYYARLQLRLRIGVSVLGMVAVAQGAAGAVSGGTLDPLTLPKYVRPMVIPPVMPAAGNDLATGATLYNIEVIQFSQQILPPADVSGRPLPSTTVRSYGAVGQPATRTYPAFTVEAQRNTPLAVNWVNSLKDANGNFLPHLLPVDQTLHWANPARANVCVDSNGNPDLARTKDCRT